MAAAGMDWWSEAACRGKPVAWFFAASKVQHYEQARAVCQSCPVREPCLQEALIEESTATAGFRFGMRGGFSPKDRDRMSRGKDKPRACRWCGERFTAQPRMVYCTARCAAQARTDSQERSRERRRGTRERQGFAPSSSQQNADIIAP